MAIREGKWKCEFCSAENLGRDMKCSSCGAVRGENVEFYLDDEAAEVTDENLVNMAEAGADWHCDYCGTDNRAGVNSCRQCGAPREGMKSREESVTGGGNHPAQQNSRSDSSRGTSDGPVKKKAPVAVIAAVILVLIIGIAAFFIFGGREDVLVLDGGEWTRTIGVERQEWVEYTAWQDDVPSGASVMERWREQRGTEKVQIGTEKVKVGTKDKGNGFFEDVYEEKPVYREDPVYDIKVRYEVIEWKQYRSVEASGSLSEKAQWPDPELTYSDREGHRYEQAVLYFHSTDSEQEGKVFTYDKLTADEMSEFAAGGEYHAEVFGTTVRKFIEE